MVHMRRAIICFCAFSFLFLLSACVLADNVPGELKCLAEQPTEAYTEGEDIATVDRYSVPRKQVLLETFGRPT
jgi:hypothetical protein